MKRKSAITALAIIAFMLFMCSVLAKYFDSARVSTGHEPILVIKTYDKDTEAVTYWGLGYKVVRYISESPEEPYGSSVGVKMGSWFMNYEKPIYRDISVEIIETNETVLITQTRDISALSDCLTNQKYFHEVCEGITDYKITINDEVYSIKSACLGVNHNGKEAHITQEDMDTILNIIKCYL